MHADPENFMAVFPQRFRNIANHRIELSAPLFVNIGYDRDLHIEIISTNPGNGNRPDRRTTTAGVPLASRITDVSSACSPQGSLAECRPEGCARCWPPCYADAFA